jgi:hypothetical protein
MDNLQHHSYNVSIVLIVREILFFKFIATMNKVNLNVAYFDYQESLGLVEKLSIDIALVDLLNKFIILFILIRKN